MEAAVNPLGTDARSLIDASTGADEPTAEDAARVHAKLAARIAVAASAGAAATGAAKSAGAATGAGASGAGAGASGAGAAAGAGASGAAAGAGMATGAGAVASAGTASIGAKILVTMALVGGSAGAGAVALRTESPSHAEVPTSAQPVSPSAMHASAPATSSVEPTPGAASEAPPLEVGAPPAQDLAETATDPEALAMPLATSPATTGLARAVASVAPAGARPATPVASAASAVEPGASSGTAAARAANEVTTLPSDAGVRSETDPAAPRDRPAASTPPDSVAEEAALLRAASGALARGDSGAALARLDEHAARFPRGALAEERQAGRVFALCADGRSQEARALASTFVAANPRSPLVSRVRGACPEPRGTGR